MVDDITDYEFIRHYYTRSCIEIASIRKTATHGPRFQQVGNQFIPLAVESLGGWRSSAAASTLRDIGQRQAARLDCPASVSIHHLFQRLSVCLWRGNASMFLNNQLSSSPSPTLCGME